MCQSEVSQTILSIRGVFNLQDLFYLMKINQDINARTLIMCVVDELCENGLIQYVEINDNCWGFEVVY